MNKKTDIISIDDIVKMTEVNENNIINKLRIKKELELKRKKDYNEELYRKCLKNIDYNVSINKFELLYNIPSRNESIKDYNFYESLIYIKKKLEKKDFIVSIILKNQSLYISWYHLFEE